MSPTNASGPQLPFTGGVNAAVAPPFPGIRRRRSPAKSPKAWMRTMPPFEFQPICAR